MRNNRLFIQLKTLSSTHTDQQVVSATKSQVANLLSIDESELGDNFFANMKRLILKERAIAENELDRLFFVAQFTGEQRTAIKDKWPDSKVTKTKIHDTKAFVFWPDGKPEGF